MLAAVDPAPAPALACPPPVPPPPVPRAGTPSVSRPVPVPVLVLVPLPLPVPLSPPVPRDERDPPAAAGALGEPVPDSSVPGGAVCVVGPVRAPGPAGLGAPSQSVGACTEAPSSRTAPLRASSRPVTVAPGRAVMPDRPKTEPTTVPSIVADPPDSQKTLQARAPPASVIDVRVAGGERRVGLDDEGGVGVAARVQREPAGDVDGAGHPVRAGAERAADAGQAGGDRAGGDGVVGRAEVRERLRGAAAGVDRARRPGRRGR